MKKSKKVSNKEEKEVAIEMKEVKFMTETHYHIPVKINGQKHFMIIDSGASRSVFDKELFKLSKNKAKSVMNPTMSAGIGTSISSDITTVDKLCIGNITIKNMLTICTDLSQINRLYDSFKIPAAIGLIGTDILRSWKSVIDFSSNKIIFKGNQKQIQITINREIENTRKLINI